jgi:hypothetical protein
MEGCGEAYWGGVHTFRKWQVWGSVERGEDVSAHLHHVTSLKPNYRSMHVMARFCSCSLASMHLPWLHYLIYAFAGVMSLILPSNLGAIAFVQLT